MLNMYLPNCWCLTVGISCENMGAKNTFLETEKKDDFEIFQNGIAPKDISLYLDVGIYKVYRVFSAY